MVQLNLAVDKHQLIYALRELDYEELTSIIKELDLMIADVGFTEDLVKVLVSSLKGDSQDVSLPFIDWNLV